MSNVGPVQRPLTKSLSTTTFSSTRPTIINELDFIPTHVLQEVRKAIHKNWSKYKVGKILNFTYLLDDDEQDDPNYNLDTVRIEPKDADENNTQPLKLRVIIPPSEETERAFLVLDQELGRGSNVVYNAAELMSNTLTACKVFNDIANNIEVLEPIRNEASNLKRLGRLQAEVSESVPPHSLLRCYIFMDHYPGAPLNEHLDKSPLCLLDKANLCISIIEEVMGFHFHQLVWRDVKLENFIVKTFPTLRLVGVDLGSAFTFEKSSKTTTLEGTTRGYVDPELFKEPTPSYTYQHDYWSLAIVLIAVLSDKNFIDAVFSTLDLHKRKWLTMDEVNVLAPDVFKEKNLKSHRQNVPSTLEELLKHLLVDLIFRLLIPMAPEKGIKARCDERGLARKLKDIKDARAKLSLETHNIEDLGQRFSAWKLSARRSNDNGHLRSTSYSVSSSSTPSASASSTPTPTPGRSDSKTTSSNSASSSSSMASSASGIGLKKSAEKASLNQSTKSSSSNSSLSTETANDEQTIATKSNLVSLDALTQTLGDVIANRQRNHESPLAGDDADDSPDAILPAFRSHQDEPTPTSVGTPTRVKRRVKVKKSG